MSKRTPWPKEKTVCSYCNITIRRDRLGAHTSSKHSGKSVKEKGWQDISMLLQSNKSTSSQGSCDVEDIGEPQSKISCLSGDMVHDIVNESVDNGNLSSAVATFEMHDVISKSASETLVHGISEHADCSNVDVQSPCEVMSHSDIECEDCNNHDETQATQPTSTYQALDDGDISVDQLGKYSTDPALYINRHMSTDVIRDILQKGPCQPGLHDSYRFEKEKNGKRMFRREWYYNTLKNGMKHYREWLIFSPRKRCAFCYPCWLFAKHSRKEFEPAFADPNYGFSNWKKATKSFIKHEQATVHKESVRELLMTRYRLKTGSTVNREQLKAFSRQVQHNREVLHRLLDITLVLAKQNLPFRGHRESSYSCLNSSSSSNTQNEGNFLELAKLLAKYDSVLNKHLSESKGKQSYLSPDIQNDFISALSSVVLDHITSEVRDSKYFGIILDSTIDISHIDQLSFCVRFIDHNFNIQERFLLFKNIENSSSVHLFEVLKKTLTDLRLDMAHLRSQAYDGAANMSGAVSGLQTRVKEVNKHALYVHCYAHKLNLVLADSCNVCTEAVTFFGYIEKVYTFITSSQPRLDIFNKAQHELNIGPRRLQRLCETRWYCKYEAVRTLKDTYPALILALERIPAKERTAKNVGDAHALLEFLQKFEFVLMLHIWLEILHSVNSLSVYLQSETMDVITASTMVTSCLKLFEQNRTIDHYNDLINLSTKFAEDNEVDTEFKVSRQRRRKCMPGEQAQDEQTNDPALHFRTTVFYTIYDRITTEMQERFNDFHNTVKCFSCLLPSHFNDRESLLNLISAYSEDIDSEAAQSEYKQLCAFYEELSPSQTPSTVCSMLRFVKDNDLQNAYPNLGILYRIFGTISVSTAKAERTFSKLRILKNYLRSTMAEERLSSLALLSIERDIAEQVDFSSVIDVFSKKKHRRMILN